MINLVPTEDKDDDRVLLDTGIACVYDGEPIEYMDLVVVLLMIKPGIENGQVLFYDIYTEDKDDYFYEPGFFHGKNWDEIEEQLERYVKERKPVEVPGAVVHCKYCKSGILPGETTGVGLIGEVHRSQRDPDLKAFGNHFEPLNVPPVILCISCMLLLNTEVQEIWGDGVCHDNECRRGTDVRCWRSGCPGNCPLKQDEDLEAEQEYDDENR